MRQHTTKVYYLPTERMVLGRQRFNRAVLIAQQDSSASTEKKGQPGLRPGYGKAMESRLELLEDNMGEMKQSLQQMLSYIGNQVSPNLSVTIGDGIQPPVDDDAVLVGSQDATNVPFDSDAHNGSYDVLQRLTPDTGVSEAYQDVFSHDNQLDESLPPLKVILDLVNVYFDWIYSWFPIIHESTFRACLYNPDRSILLHGIVVAASRYLGEQHSSLGSVDSWSKTSREHILLRAVGSCNLVATQALALLAIDAFGQGSGPRTWNIMSLLITASRHLELTKVTTRR